VVAVGNNVKKSSIFTPQERVQMLREACVDWRGVTVTLFDGLLVDFCTQHEVQVIAKGVRSVSDFDYELAMAQMNRALTGVDTAFLPTDPRWSYLSSSLVREVAVLGGDVTPFLPPGIAERTLARVRQQSKG
jgi:pantetheine-phosphate adenylyltransferase